MLPTYPATLRNGRIEWGPNGPPALPTDESVPIEVTILNPPPTPPSDGRSLLELFEALAAGGAFSEIEDVVEWQREQRKDRALPGRES